MNAILFGLIALVGWGSGDVFGTYATRRVGPYITTFWAFAFSAMLASFYVPFALDDLSRITPALLVANIILGVLYIGGNLTFNEALRTSSAPIVGTIGGSFAALTIVLSYIFLGEAISPLRIVLTVLVFCGVYITSTSQPQAKNTNMKKGILLALVSFVVWGIYFTFIKILIQQIGWFWPNYIPLLLFPLIWLYMKHKSIPFVMPKLRVGVPLFFNALALRGGDFAFNIGASLGHTAAVAPLGGAYPILFAILSYIVFRDPLNKKAVFGILLALLSLVALGFVGQ